MRAHYITLQKSCRYRAWGTQKLLDVPLIPKAVSFKHFQQASAKCFRISCTGNLHGKSSIREMGYLTLKRSYHADFWGSGSKVRKKQGQLDEGKREEEMRWVTEEGRLNRFIQFNTIFALALTSWDHLVLSTKSK